MFPNAGIVKSRLLGFKYLTKRSKDAIEAYFTHLKAKECSDNTIQNYFLQICYALEDIKKPLEEITLQDVEEHVVKIMDKTGPSTIRARKVSLKQILKHMLGKDSPLADYTIQVTKKEKEILKKKHRRTLTRDELKSLMQSARNNQERVMLYFLYISGVRVGELCLMNIGDIEFTDKGMKVRVSSLGKTGERFIPIYEQALVEDIRHYLINHPHRINPKGPFWYSEKNINYHGRINRETVRQRLNYAKENAKFEKSINPHLFRHARASELGSVFTDRQMMAYFGWNSPKMCSVYCNHHIIDVSNKLAVMAGVEPENKQVNGFEDMAEVCPRCGHNNGSGMGICAECGQGLTKESLEQYRLITVGRGIEQITKEDENLRKALAEFLEKKGF